MVLKITRFRRHNTPPDEKVVLHDSDESHANLSCLSLSSIVARGFSLARSSERLLSFTKKMYNLYGEHMGYGIETTEVDIVRRAKDGDEKSFSLLVKRHTTRTYRIAFSLLKNRSDAEDAVQDAFITAYRSIKKLKNEAAFGAWLARIVTTRSYDILRKRQRNKLASSDEDSSSRMERIPTKYNSPEAVELSFNLRWAVDHLPETHRLIILLHYTEGATTDEIANIVRRPPGTVRRMLSESYRLMRPYLEEEKHREV
ncbi:MAG: sigma-70 family RNA polymerase sigma factor [Dehalococcoidia bacterium]|nr:sigma-70 family RNA polymerase sigma factor [Dehalococcoidia bacterium]